MITIMISGSGEDSKIAFSTVLRRLPVPFDDSFGQGVFMLKLVDIVKDYRMADSVVHALKGINLNFRKSEFVSILGPSGCGKTTMLNIIGGLDKYTDGDLIINEKSTKEFKSRD